MFMNFLNQVLKILLLLLRQVLVIVLHKNQSSLEPQHRELILVVPELQNPVINSIYHRFWERIFFINHCVKNEVVWAIVWKLG